MTTDSGITLIAALDANVIIPASPRDLLLRLAGRRLYAPVWSDRILDEVERNLVRTGMTSEAGAARLVSQIRHYFPRALVYGYESLIDQMPIVAEDRHVLAAAVHRGADIVVTRNLRHFPDAALHPFGVRALSVDQFLIQLYETAPEAVRETLHSQADDLMNPPLTVDELLENIALHAPEFVARIRGDIETR